MSGEYKYGLQVFIALLSCYDVTFFVTFIQNVMVDNKKQNKCVWDDLSIEHMGLIRQGDESTPWYDTSSPPLATLGHRRRVTAVTRLPRWRRWKTRLQVRPLLTMLQDMDRCDILHASIYWIGLTFYILMFGHHASEWHNESLVFSGGRRVT